MEGNSMLFTKCFKSMSEDSDINPDCPKCRKFYKQKRSKHLKSKKYSDESDSEPDDSDVSMDANDNLVKEKANIDGTEPDASDSDTMRSILSDSSNEEYNKKVAPKKRNTKKRYCTKSPSQHFERVYKSDKKRGKSNIDESDRNKKTTKRATKNGKIKNKRTGAPRKPWAKKPSRNQKRPCCLAAQKAQKAQKYNRKRKAGASNKKDVVERKESSDANSKEPEQNNNTNQQENNNQATCSNTKNKTDKAPSQDQVARAAENSKETNNKNTESSAARGKKRKHESSPKKLSNNGEERKPIIPVGDDKKRIGHKWSSSSLNPNQKLSKRTMSIIKDIHKNKPARDRYHFACEQLRNRIKEEGKEDFDYSSDSFLFHNSDIDHPDIDFEDVISLKRPKFDSI